MKRPLAICDLRFAIWEKSGRAVSPLTAADAHGVTRPTALNRQPSIVNGQFRRAFTLIEMLVVISILGILAALTVPALKNLGKSNAAISASRQLLQAVGRARQLAIANRTTVYMIFVPTNFWTALESLQALGGSG